MSKLQPIVVWSLEGALLRRDSAESAIKMATKAWMGHSNAWVNGLKESPDFREKTDNEVVRAVLHRSGINASDWMIQGALTHHERCLIDLIRQSPSLATPGIETALAKIDADGIQQLVLSWHTENASHLKLKSAHLEKFFEVLCGNEVAANGEQRSRTGLSGIFSGTTGSFEAILEALVQWSDGSPLILVTASPREIIEATRLGISCFGVTSGGVHPIDLSRSGASLVITERTGLEKINRMVMGAQLS